MLHIPLREIEWTKTYDTLNNMGDDLCMSVELRNQLRTALSGSGFCWIDNELYECLLVEIGSPDMLHGIHVTKFGKPGFEIRVALSYMARNGKILK